MTKNKSNSETKKIIKFIAICIAIFIVGMAAGILARIFTDGDTFYEASAKVGTILTYITPWIFVAFNVILFAACQICYAKSRVYERALTVANENEEEEIYDKIENLLSYPILFSNVIVIGNFFFFGANSYITEHTEFGIANNNLIFGITIAIFILQIIYTTAIQKLVIDMEKRLNPEKRGSIFDKSFQKDWLNSCDEAQKLATYKAAYEAYKSMNTICSFLWIICLISEFVYDTGVLPIFTVCLIWGITNVRYCIACIKIEKGEL